VKPRCALPGSFGAVFISSTFIGCERLVLVRLPVSAWPLSYFNAGEDASATVSRLCGATLIKPGKCFNM
jgi:hypothetical protein